jgi:hypothetical protein
MYTRMFDNAGLCAIMANAPRGADMTQKRDQREPPIQKRLDVSVKVDIAAILKAALAFLFAVLVGLGILRAPMGGGVAKGPMSRSSASWVSGDKRPPLQKVEALQGRRQ